MLGDMKKLTIRPNTCLNSAGTFCLMKEAAALAICAASVLLPASKLHSISALQS